MRQAVSNARKQLVERGYIVVDGDTVSVSKSSEIVSGGEFADTDERQQNCQRTHPSRGGADIADTPSRPTLTVVP
jgi:hypothetical protein